MSEGQLMIIEQLTARLNEIVSTGERLLPILEKMGLKPHHGRDYQLYRKFRALIKKEKEMKLNG